jgi:hypothetical protein
MKNMIRTLCLAVAFTLCAFALSYGDDPVGVCHIRCLDGTLVQLCDVTFVRCRVQFNNICGGVGQYTWEESGTCP